MPRQLGPADRGVRGGCQRGRHITRCCLVSQGLTVLQGFCWTPGIEGVLGHPVLARAPSAAACGSDAGTSISLEPSVVERAVCKMGFRITGSHSMGDCWASLPHGMSVALFGPAGSVLRCSFSFFASAQGRACPGDGKESPTWEQEQQSTGIACKPGCTRAAG